MPVFYGRLASTIVLAVCLAGSFSEASATSARITMGPGGRVTGIQNLVPRDECFPATIQGRVVKRDFDRSGLYLAGIVVEEKKGTRTFINVDNEYVDKDAVTTARTKSALEEMLAIGKKVNLGVYACGAAGRTLNVHSVKVAR
ncbi:hypothetical protein [Methylobacterium oryzihabitans]|uniref:DUF5666 domain-containing protein n=1 Tax=Methylobacterium oryzihabitans TaxID=2499852 RepID=A0A3S2XP20_9HYPH|nr:hypothetical protein [Methylobacterium oryzihabitans]RVU19476.1 hypothetical protein EOE48_08750 [Methylobacterium oryzihabitans]